MLITEAYKKLNAQLHDDLDAYGSLGGLYAPKIKQLARDISATSILDYGCGKRSLEKALGFAIANYDPAIPGMDEVPEPADLVVCTDVLEHIEMECLDAVLDDLKRVTKEMIFMTVCIVAAKKKLADGTNAHKIIQPAKWWLPRIMERFEMMSFMTEGNNFLVIGRPYRVLQ